MGGGEQVQAGLVGVGFIADYHVRAILKLDGVSITAVCDLDAERAANFADRHGVPHSYGSVEAMLDAHDLGVVHVLTPAQAHLGPLLSVVGRGIDVIAEKPLTTSVSECEQVAAAGSSSGSTIGVSHNFLAAEAYDRLIGDVRSGRLGHIDQIDIVWNRVLPQIRSVQTDSWVFEDPRNILFEVAPHVFSQAIHLAGRVDDLAVDARGRRTLSNGRVFYDRWEIRGWAGDTAVRMRMSFGEGYPEYYVHVHGSHGSGHIDYENLAYTSQRHTTQGLAVDRFVNVVNAASHSAAQAAGTFAREVASKTGVIDGTDPYSTTIQNSIRLYYETRAGTVDERLSVELATAAVDLAERCALEVPKPIDPPAPTNVARPASPPQPTVLVLGGSGFIGRAVIERLQAGGAGVRVVSRRPEATGRALAGTGVDVVGGDLGDVDSMRTALGSIQHVVHLARGDGRAEDYLASDVEPTERLAQACVDLGVERLIYASSIAIYDAGDPDATITEDTPPAPGIVQANPYAWSKVENEQRLMRVHREHGLPVVIHRPGIVLGAGGAVRHLGIGTWPHPSACRLYGSGDTLLPIVLVDDVADAIVRMIETPAAIGKSYNLVGDPLITGNDYLDEIEAATGVVLGRAQVPSWRAFGVNLSKWAFRSFGGGGEPRPTFADWRARTFAARLSNDRARGDLGWEPVADRSELVERAIREPARVEFGTRQLPSTWST